MKSYFKSQAGKNSILALYQAKLDAVQTACKLNIESLYLNTDWGEVHLLSCGAEEKPPLLLLHGSNAMAPIALEEYPNLHKHFRVYALDIPAQPNRSRAERPDMKDLSYGKLVDQVLAQLDLENVTLVGFSWGGLVALKSAAYSGTRIKALYLAAPAYIVNGNPFKLLFKMFRPLKAYLKKPDPAKLDLFLDFLFTKSDDFARQFLDQVFRHFELDFSPVPKIKAKEAMRINTPIYLFAGKYDQIFPGAKMLKRAKKLFPTLEESHLLKAKHVFSSEHNQLVEKIIIDKQNPYEGALS